MKRSIGFGVIAVCMMVVCALMTVNTAWAAEKYPSRPVTIIVTFAPGGVSDVTARLWARYLEKYVGGTVVVDHKPGGGGIVGFTYIANARPDGYTLGNVGEFVTPIMSGTATYKLEDLWVIAQVALNGCALAVSADAPWKTWQEFADYAKKNPGVKWAHNGIGTMITFRTENLNKQAGLKLIGLPRNGDAEVITALLGKHAVMGSLSAFNAKAQVDAGKLRILLSFDDAKAFGLDPNIPSFASVYPKMQDITVALYLIAPRKTPKEIIDALETALEKMTKDPGFISETEKLFQMVSFLPGKVVMEDRIPKKMAIMKPLMEEAGMITK